MDKQTAKLIARIAENMPHMESELMQNWIDNPKGLQKALKGALCPPEMKAPPSTLETFFRLKLGTGLKSADDFRRALTEANCKIGSWADRIFNKSHFTASHEEVEVELVAVSAEELGFNLGATLCQVYSRASQFGLGLCPIEVGPQLRLQYTHQPRGEYVLVAMEPIAVPSWHIVVFVVARDIDGEHWLRSAEASPHVRVGASTRFVFVRWISGRV